MDSLEFRATRDEESLPCSGVDVKETSVTQMKKVGASRNCFISQVVTCCLWQMLTRRKSGSQSTWTKREDMALPPLS